MKIGSFKFLKDKKQKKFPQPFGKFCYDTEVSYQFWCEREIHLDNKDLFVVTSGPLREKRPCLLGAKENWTWVVPALFVFLTLLLWLLEQRSTEGDFLAVAEGEGEGGKTSPLEA